MNNTLATIRDRESLQTALAHGLEPQFQFFWGHRVAKDGSTGKSCLSQWYPSPFEIAGITYPTAEHYMMAEKARLFEDVLVEGEILAAPDPSAAKKLGRGVQNYDEAAWRKRRFAAVVEGNLAKFGQNESLGDFLKATEECVLVEASPRDRIWGIGMGADNPDACDPARWRGQNLLGFALMETRALLRNNAA